MKWLFYLILFLMISCKDEETAQFSATRLETLAGTWRLTAEEQGFVGQISWRDITSDSATNLTFRSDGIVLNALGLPFCCAPNALTINGKFLEIKPVEPLPANVECQLVNCPKCPIWDIVVTGNEMILSSCNAARRRYVRI
jgi:hypothetical protein